MEELNLSEEIRQKLLHQAEIQACSVDTLLARLLNEGQQTKADLHALMEASPSSIVFMDRELRIRSINAATEGEFKRFFPDHQMIGGSMYDFMMPEHYEIFDTSLRQALDGQPSTVERLSVTPNGQQIRYVFRFQPVFDDQRQVTGVCLMADNVTLERTVEDAFLETYALYQSLVDVLPMSLYRTNEKRELTFVNRRILEELNVTMDQVLGKKADDFYPEDLARKYYQDDLRVLKGETLTLIEEHFRPADGQTTYVEVVKTPLYDYEGNIVGIQGLFWDVTSRMEAEEHQRLQMLLKKEQELNAIQTNLIMTISHEFRTPITVISSSSELLAQYYDRLTKEQRSDRLDKIRKQIKRLTTMLDEIALVIRSSMNQYTLKRREVNIEQLCLICIDEIKETLGEYHNFVFIGDHQLKEAMVDETLVSRILINLLSNAVKYSPKHSQIKVELHQENHNTVIQVTDQGIGIAPEEMEQIFDPFFRASNIENVKGTGLGLSIVKECVRLHQGEINVKSELSQGTTFIVRLPL